MKRKSLINITGAEYNAMADRDARRPPKHAVQLSLTELEADMLNLVVGNGWGDGDFADWLPDKAQSDACRRAMRKLRAAIKKHQLTA